MLFHNCFVPKRSERNESFYDSRRFRYIYINLIPDQMFFKGLYFVDEETATANLEMAALHTILMTGYEIM